MKQQFSHAPGCTGQTYKSACICLSRAARHRADALSEKALQSSGFELYG